MNERKDHLIGARFSKREKRLIENFIKTQNLSLSDFLRQAVFSHMNELNDNVGNIDVHKMLTSFGEIENFCKIILKNINNLKEEIDIYGLKKLNMEFNKINLSSKETF